MSENILGSIISVSKTNREYLIVYETGELAKLNILNSHVLKYYMSPTGDFLDYPIPYNPEDIAKINVKKVTDYDLNFFEESYVKETDKHYTVHTTKIHIIFNRLKGTMTIHDKRTNKNVLHEVYPLSYANNNSVQTLHHHKDEYFFGGGMQNGRFTHKGEVIKIVNTNNWVDGGVTSPCPFYWSTYGYGVLRNTWQNGVYDFGSDGSDTIITTHKGEDFDAFYFINPQPTDILTDYYELTGQPILMPEYAFYQAHLNAFNRDYWVKVDPNVAGAILFEDGYYYKSYQPNEMDGKVGILESLNGENNNYQFSARAMIDRYKKHDMPLGWFIPNDGYGSGYGQTDSLEGDIENLKVFADYARSKGIEAALWTESQLEPKDPENPKKGERDLKKEVGVAGVVALKCDVAWIGSGYSFGLNAVENATNMFIEGAHHKARPMIIMVDGWAGTQRYSGIWSGDQSGGNWEYIRFHIPTYIGSGLSGQPIIGSDMDGIYSGKNKEVNIRDFQWKTFTPLQLNMDGWGTTPKTPFSFDSEATAINRSYLKLKSMLMPYNYTINHESIHGLPMLKAMFLEFPDEISGYTLDSQYQFMWGPSILVAPVYREDILGNTQVRNGIYLPDPEQVWIDLFTFEKYRGGKILNNYKTPLWKIPVFVKDGAIIPMTNPNNNPYEIKRDNRIFLIYPNGESKFEVYEDDGKTDNYLDRKFAKTHVTVIGPETNERGNLRVHINKTIGSYENMIKKRTTTLRIMTTKDIDHIKLTINDETINLTKVATDEEFYEEDNVFYFKKDFSINPYLDTLAGEVLFHSFLLVKIQTVDVTANEIHLKIKNYENKSKIFGDKTNIDDSLTVPSNLTAIEDKNNHTSIVLNWNEVEDAQYYEIERDGIIFTNILGKVFTFENFKYDSKHTFRIRSLNDRVSRWSAPIEVQIKEDPLKTAVKNLIVKCNIPCEPSHEVCRLTDLDESTMWHTDWKKPGEADPSQNKVIKLFIDLKNTHSIDRVEYTPRNDFGNGTFQKIQYRHSNDGDNWSLLSNPIELNYKENIETLKLNAQFRFMEIHVLEAVGGFGSGKHLIFYKT